jgi:[ribosomal protein S5]-alanine N-acetyltransferase
MIIPSLSTRNLFLRPWQPADAQSLLDILQEPGILQYFPPTSFTLERTQRYISHHLDHWKTHGYGHWAVTQRDDGALLGWSGLEYLPETNETEVAYLLSHKVWGRGFATQAAQAAVTYGMQNTRLTGIIGLVHPDNAASIRVLEKCGLVFVDRKTYWGLEMLRYSILAEG